MWLNQYPFTLQKAAPGGNMSYIPPWVPSGSAGGHYPPHMIPSQQPANAHSPQSTMSSSPSPLGSPQLYQSVSPGSKGSSCAHGTVLTQSNGSPKTSTHLGSSSSPPTAPSQSSHTSVTEAAAAAAAATAAAVAAAVAASASGPNSSPSGANHGGNSQGSNHDGFDSHGSPVKYPAPEQLSTPVMYSYQGRGRPRKHFSHAGLPTMVPVTHPSLGSDDGDDDENKPFRCNLCLKGFKLKGGLQQHERTHSSDRPYICPECGKLFRQPTHLQQHMRIHTGEKPYDCTFCDKSFRQRTILNQHLRIHTGEKPYVCMECGKNFRQKAILDQHYRTHLGDKPYACPHPSCRKHFREMASLISHMKCHKDVPDPKIVLQQAKRFIKEEKLDEYGNHEGNGVVAGLSGSNIEVVSIPHSSHLSNNHNGPTDRPSTASGARYHNNGDAALPNARSFSSAHRSGSPEGVQRSPHSMHAHSQNNAEAAEQAPHSQSLPSGMMPTPPQMAMANLIPFPHSIFPPTSYMMTPPNDPRQYHQIHPAVSQGGVGGGLHAAALARTNQ